MASFKSDSWGDPQHQANKGNSHVYIMKHTVNANDVQNGVVRMSKTLSKQQYFSVRVANNATLGAGVTLDVGVSNQETGVDTANAFAAGVVTSSASNAEILNEPVTVDDMHEIIVTFKGANPTAGATFTIIAQSQHNGA